MSEAAKPVPPVVRTRSQPPPSAHRRRQRSISSRSSLTRSRPASVASISVTNAASASPHSSLPPSRARELLTVTTAARSGSLLGTPVMLAAALLQQPQAVDDDAALQPLDHVVKSECRNRAGGHRLHLDSGAGGRRRFGL